MRKNLKKYFLALAVIAVIAVTAGASVYLWIYRVKIDGNSKIILSYFENAQVQIVDEYEDKDYPYYCEDAFEDEIDRLPKLLTYKGREYAVRSIKVSKGQLAAGEGEENIHELKDISYKLAVVYEYENEYYLYKYFNEEQPIDPEAIPSGSQPNGGRDSTDFQRPSSSASPFSLWEQSVTSPETVPKTRLIPMRFSRIPYTQKKDRPVRWPLMPPQTG